MSVEVSGLTKKYNDQWAVKNLTFKANKGEILGFLGPNGAGKSTTMKMLSCFIEPSAGDATLCGQSILSNPIEVRSKLGYLAEHNPLYLDMYVSEFLRFSGALYGMSRVKKRVEDVIEMTGLGLERHKKIVQLSKGFRQRVGLAHSLLHDPEVLILDEPTSGLDPNQLVEIRGLIKDISKDKTVIFSSHIMQEVQALCDRVVIINQGEKVADGFISDLDGFLEQENRVSVLFQEGPSDDFFRDLKSLKRWKMTDIGCYEFVFEKAVDGRREVFNQCLKTNTVLLEMIQQTSNVEQIFQKLTETK